jgi:UDP-2-acetamido-2,6-beta-L-arabino-hexul-4-ose reductase
MKILVTGGDGFLGWHTRVRLGALTEHEVVSVSRGNWADLPGLIKDVDAVIHVAGVNRGTPSQLEHGNIELAQSVAKAASDAASLSKIVYANSIWAGTASPYGSGKAGANFILGEAASELGAEYVDVRLPNLFGEHGRPRYNSFVATFVDAVINDTTPEIVDRPMDLLHVQPAAQALIDGLTTSAVAPPRAVRHADVGASRLRHPADVLRAVRDRRYPAAEQPVRRRPVQHAADGNVPCALLHSPDRAHR